MDDIISAALEEICVRGSYGILLPELWSSLQAAVSSSGLELSDVVKKVIWGRLAYQPGLRFMVSDSWLEPKEVLQGSMAEMERRGLSIVGEESLRDSFLGLYDLKQSKHFEISQIQRRVLERLAMTRSNGITQSEIAKEFDIKGTNFHYVVKTLEYQQLIVKQSTIVREKESVNLENAQKVDQVVHTNLLHLSRYAKNVNLNSQQRIEITRTVLPQMLDESVNVDHCSFPIEGFEDCLKEDVHIKDFIPAMQAICDKLEAAQNKVAVISGIKTTLGYRLTSGHRLWRNILYRLKYSGTVEEFQAKVNGKDVSCLRLLKKFDPKYFQQKVSMHNGSSSVKNQKRGQITDQLVEIPLEQQIYDMIDAAGEEGITNLELSKRLGINVKKLLKRILSLREKFGVVSQSEIHDKQQAYRFWTCSLQQHEPSKSYFEYGNFFHGNELSAQAGALVAYEQPLDSDFNGEDLLVERAHNAQEFKTHSPSCQHTSEVIESEQEPEERAHEINFTGSGAKSNKGSNTSESGATTSIACLSTSASVTTPSSFQPISASPLPTPRSQKYACRSLTAFTAQREQRILEKLENEKVLLKTELHKCLEDIEKDKPSTMDRKTLDRSLKRLQDAGLCKCIGVRMPSLTNFKSLRYTEAVLHPSVNLSQELLQQIYERQRTFDTWSRRYSASAKLRHEESVEFPELKTVKRADTQVDDSPAFKALRENGFVLAKMVRVKLLHNFLWSYLSSSPYWQSALSSSRKDNADVVIPADNCELFSLDAAIKEMPLELFLQVAGSKLVIDNLEKKCKQGLRLCDLSVQERRCLLDTQATSRLSAIIEILYRLRLILLVNKGAVQDVNLLSHALELHPYLEEPVPAVLSSSDIKRSNDFFKYRHDFILSEKESVDRYWETLEYCFAAADPVYSRQCFPGSSVEEVFHRRSWCSVRVMTTDQRMELLKRVANIDQSKKITFCECVKISRELNVTLEQVLRVYYDRRHISHSESSNIVGAAPRKKQKLSNHGLHDYPPNVPVGELTGATERTSFDIEEVMQICSSYLSAGKNLSVLHGCRAGELRTAEIQPQLQEEADVEMAALIQKCALDELKPTHKGRFSWNDTLDRKLVMQYARHRAMLGVRFVRVEWSSLYDLPAQPETCKRRMAVLNRKFNIRRAVLKLCNLLGERYTRYLDESRYKIDRKLKTIGDFEESDEGVILCDAAQKDSVSSVYIHKTNSQHCWDDFEDSELKLALDEVLKYIKITKKDDAKRLGCRVKEGWSNQQSSDDLNFTSHEPEKYSASSCAEAVLNDSNARDPDRTVASASTQNRSNKYSSREKLLKFRKNSSILRVSIANAVELLKVVFLSCSKSSGVQDLLARTLQKYSQDDIMAAFCYLREKNYLVIGHGSRPFVLSRKFFHNCFSSPFPSDSCKRATNFHSWLQKKQNDLIHDGVAIASDLHCAEIFHLSSLVLSGEMSVSPHLPNCEVGETGKLRGLESNSLLGYTSDICALKNSKHMVGVPCKGEKVKKLKSQAKADCDRREKGFPAIKIFLNMESVSGADAFECFEFGDKYSHTCAGDSISDKEAVCLVSSLDNADVPYKFGSQSCWEAMTRYFTILSSACAIGNEAWPSSTDFKFVHSFIFQAGEQGVSMDEISGILKVKGKKVAEMFVDTLEAFHLAAKVNAFDSVLVVDASYASKYFIKVLGGTKIHNQDYNIFSCTRPETLTLGSAKNTFQERGNKDDFLMNPRVSLFSGNKTLAYSISNNPSEHFIEGQPHGVNANVVEETKNSESFLAQYNAVGHGGNPTEMTGVFCPILPWINGDGNTNINVYKGLVHRIFGIVMQNPSILEEDIITKMDVLNPQSCRILLETMVLDNHIMVRWEHEAATAAPLPILLQSLLPPNLRQPTLTLRKHYFANPMSTRML